MNTITTKTTVHAPVGIVWEKYTKPEHVVKWSFASDDWECTSAQSDLRVGGKFCNHLAAKDKSFELDFEGTYTEIIQDKSIKYTMTDGRKVDVAFDSDREETTVTVVFDPERENSEEMQRAGWQAFLDNFTKYVEST